MATTKIDFRDSLKATIQLASHLIPRNIFGLSCASSNCSHKFVLGATLTTRALPAILYQGKWLLLCFLLLLTISKMMYRWIWIAFDKGNGESPGYLFFYVYFGFIRMQARISWELAATSCDILIWNVFIVKSNLHVRGNVLELLLAYPCIFRNE